MRIEIIFLKIFIIIFFVSFCALISAQDEQYTLIDAQTHKEYAKKDSISAVKFLDSLAENNYYFTRILSVEKVNKNTKINFDKGKNYNQAYVKISDSLAREIKTESVFFTKNLDSLKKYINKKYIDKGYAFSRVKSKYKGLKDGSPQVEISIISDKKRTIDRFVIKGYEKVPKRFVKNIEKEYRGKIYGEKNLTAINQSLQNQLFVSLERPPQTLFTKDSTQIFLFLRKKKSNTFDGVIGFGNDSTEKFTLNGTLDVNFKNMFNGFEAINIYWQRNADSGQTFDLKIDVPYLFKSNIGLNVNTNIYRQDSTFANVKFLPSLYFHISNRQKIGVRATLETSTVIAEDYTSGNDYNKKGVGLWYEFSLPSDIELFLYKTRFRTEADLISAKYAEVENSFSQNKFFISAEHNLHIKNNHYLNFKGEASALYSKGDLSTNELLRFGGWNSLKGFNENTLIADSYAYGGAEYRYLIANQAFFDVFAQYAQLNNKLLSEKPKFYSFGLGFNFFIPLGLMSFQISNGSQAGNPFKFGDTKIHWGILSRF